MGALAALEPEVVEVFGAGKLEAPVIGVATLAGMNLHGGDPEHYRGLGYTEHASLERGDLAAGGSFIPKPFSRDHLLERVRARLDQGDAPPAAAPGQA